MKSKYFVIILLNILVGPYSHLFAAAPYRPPYYRNPFGPRELVEDMVIIANDTTLSMRKETIIASISISAEDYKKQEKIKAWAE